MVYKKYLLGAALLSALIATSPSDVVAGTPTPADDEFHFGKAGDLINADAAHSVGADGGSVLIAIADTGLLPDQYYPLIETKGAVQAHYNFYYYDRGVETYGIGEYVHAHLMATIAAGRRNGLGGQGIAYAAPLHSYKISEGVQYAPRSVSHVADMLAQVRADQAGVMSGAWGWMTYSPPEHFDRDYARSVLYPIAHEVSLMGEGGATGYRGTALVFAAGNIATPDPANVMALIPYWYPELQSKFITAVALDITDWQPGDPAQNLQLASYSSQCGVAKDWCITAPGHGFPFLWDAGSVGSAAGTSSATAITVGALAVLMDAFPEISAEDAIAIALETATDIGLPGVDDVFGHGLLNLEAALQPIGPFELSTDQGTVSAAGSAFGSSALLGDGFSDALDDSIFVYQDVYGRYYEGTSDQISGSNTGGQPDLTFPPTPGGRNLVQISPSLALSGQGGMVWQGETNGVALVVGLSEDRAIMPYGALPFDHISGTSMVTMLAESDAPEIGVGRWMAGIVASSLDETIKPSLFGTWQYMLNENVSMQAGVLAEHGQLHGATGRGVLAYQGISITGWSGMAGHWSLGDNLELMADAHLGYLNYADTDTQLGLTRLSGFTAKAQIALRKNDSFMRGDELKLSIGLPETILSGRASLKLPDRGFARRESFSFNNTPELEAKLQWSLRF